MILLNTTTLRLETFEGNVPPYAIFSHTWGCEEILYQDICDEGAPLPQHKQGWGKVSEGCRVAREAMGHKHIWIDNCCIDKRSSAELSEAINSMFVWYREAVMCIAYLADVESLADAESLAVNIDVDDNGVTFEHSRWFTRGWTLQELIAPKNVVFYSTNWTKLGDRNGTLLSRISEITRIPEGALKHYDECPDCLAPYELDGKCTRCKQWNSDRDLHSYSVAFRMSWAANRVTTRKEDEAYCLMGLFGVHMPPLYGERDQAFQRLQLEILRISNDQSIFCWSAPPQEDQKKEESGMVWEDSQLLAPCPACFSGMEFSRLEDPIRWTSSQTFYRPNIFTSGREVSVDVHVCWNAGGASSSSTSARGQYFAVLDCTPQMDSFTRPAISVKWMNPNSNSDRAVYARYGQSILWLLTWSEGNSLSQAAGADGQSSVTARPWQGSFARTRDTDFALSWKVKTSLRHISLLLRSEQQNPLEIRIGTHHRRIRIPAIRLRFQANMSYEIRATYPSRRSTTQPDLLPTCTATNHRPKAHFNLCGLVVLGPQGAAPTPGNTILVAWGHSTQILSRDVDSILGMRVSKLSQFMCGGDDAGATKTALSEDAMLEVLEHTFSVFPVSLSDFKQAESVGIITPGDAVQKGVTLKCHIFPLEFLGQRMPVLEVSETQSGNEASGSSTGWAGQSAALARQAMKSVKTFRQPRS
ncbi:HET-domain-containing protein [Zalerion maritima]|uniref:HET-domain-containing protein n=1 Tax=Zalerion maritima TaxID=339359 RepID=A0AAD5RKJ5_9PEZI|nr:HET-domain-containing protein [Zalerion maritima]